MNLFNVISQITHSGRTSFFVRRRRAVLSISASNNLGHVILILFYLNIFNVHGFEDSSISYVDECKADCAKQTDLFTCGKYRAVKWLHNLTTDKDIHLGSVRLVQLSSPTKGAVLPELRRLREIGRYSKFLDFVRSSAEDMLTRRALVYTVEQSVSARSFSSGPFILDTDELREFVELGRSMGEDRGLKKKKKTLSVIVPLLILLKVFKIKLILIPMLLALHFIKKVVLFGALALPSLLGHLKYCKIPPPHHTTSYSTWNTAAEAPVDFSLASGHEDEGWNQKVDMMGYGGPAVHDWNAQRSPYRRYYQAAKE